MKKKVLTAAQRIKKTATAKIWREKNPGKMQAIRKRFDAAHPATLDILAAYLRRSV